ncbi:MAG: hypothetical protein JWM71_118 [Solirubrobacteraceae bacterium]|nr:hypothetical protein [Solirubrobacteraceae bacterium]
MGTVAASILGWMCGALLLVAALAAGVDGVWPVALLFVHGAGGLWLWATWLQEQ